MTIQNFGYVEETPVCIEIPVYLGRPAGNKQVP
jgi:hypothetical protein